MPQVSFCSTSYNTEPVTRRSLESVAEHSKGIESEFVVVDNISNDGTFEALERFGREFPLRTERKRCTRGVGRQRAFELSEGEYVVTFDLDTVYNPLWGRLLRWVLENRAAFGIGAAYSQFYPRTALRRVGGWRDLQYWEDVDLWARLAAHGLYRTYPVRCGENLKRVPGTSALERAFRLYMRNRDKVATTPHIPFDLYWSGYLRLIARTRRLSASLNLAAFLPAYVTGRVKQRRLWRDHSDPSILLNEGLILDLGFEPRESWVPVASRYDTVASCREALAHDDLGFLPGFYD